MHGGTRARTRPPVHGLFHHVALIGPHASFGIASSLLRSAMLSSMLDVDLLHWQGGFAFAKFLRGTYDPNDWVQVYL